MRKKASRKKRQAARRTYSEELKTEAVQMLLSRAQRGVCGVEPGAK